MRREIGRVRLRPNRGFSLGLAQQCHPPKFSLGLSDHFTLPEQIGILASAIFFLKLMAARIVIDSNL